MNALKTNDKLKMILNFALDIGNYINGSKTQGQAFGFSISTLEKLDQFPRKRIVNGKKVPTLLEYMFVHLRDNKPSMLEWTEELECLEDTTNTDLKSVNIKMEEFNKKLKELDIRLKQFKSNTITNLLSKSDKSEQIFYDKMLPFYTNAKLKLSQFNSNVNKLNTNLTKLGEYFGIQNDPEYKYFENINDFRKDFYKVEKRLEKQKLDEIRKEKRLRKEEERKAAKLAKKQKKNNANNVNINNKRKHSQRAVHGQLDRRASRRHNLRKETLNLSTKRLSSRAITPLAGVQAPSLNSAHSSHGHRQSIAAHRASLSIAAMGGMPGLVGMAGMPGKVGLPKLSMGTDAHTTPASPRAAQGGVRANLMNFVFGIDTGVAPMGLPPPPMDDESKGSENVNDDIVPRPPPPPSNAIRK